MNEDSTTPPASPASAPTPPTPIQQTVGEWLGDAHGWARKGLDEFIKRKIDEARALGIYANIADADIVLPMLREHIYLIHAIFQSLPFDKDKGLDAMRMATPQQCRGRAPVIPTFRTLIAELLGVPNPYAVKAAEGRDDWDQEGKEL